MGAGLIQSFADALVYGKDLLMPAMVILWFAAVVGRVLVYHLVSREDWFAREFEKRVVNFLDKAPAGETRSFYATLKLLLEKTYYELFEIRGIMKRRKLDYVHGPADRVFMVQAGAAWLVRDTLRDVRHLRHGQGEAHDFLEVSKTNLGSNPYFTRIFGRVSAGLTNDLLNIIPGIFIVLGVFGTFLGIMEALPSLSGMDVMDGAATKKIMDEFLVKIAFSMTTSVVGIALSVSLTMFFAALSPEKLFMRVVHRFERAMYRLWHSSSNNTLPSGDRPFDEHRDPIEALAELSVSKELARTTDASSSTEGSGSGASAA